MTIEQRNWNEVLAKTLRQIAERRVRLVYTRRRPKTRFVTIIGEHEGAVIGFLEQVGVLVSYLGLFDGYARTKEGKEVANYLINQYLDPHDNDFCYAINDTALNELSIRISYGRMPKLREEITQGRRTLVPVDSTMVNHPDWPYGTI